MSDDAAQLITERLHGVGSDWADVGDSVKAVMRVATDEEINGRALAIIPKKEFKAGYVDMERDDYKEESPLRKWLAWSSGFTHRALPKEKQ